MWLAYNSIYFFFVFFFATFLIHYALHYAIKLLRFNSVIHSPYSTQPILRWPFASRLIKSWHICKSYTFFVNISSASNSDALSHSHCTLFVAIWCKSLCFIWRSVYDKFAVICVFFVLVLPALCLILPFINLNLHILRSQRKHHRLHIH